MPILQQYLFVIGGFQGLLLSGLLIFGTRNTNASRILGVWCLFLALSFLGPFITLSPGINLFSGLIGWSFFLPASYGALLFLYCRHAIINRPLRAADLVHFTPLLLCYLLNSKFLLASGVDKLAYLRTDSSNSVAFMIGESILFLQAFVYLVFSAALVRKYQKEAKNTLSSFNPEIFSWLWKLLVIDLVIWSLKAAASYYGYFFIFSTAGDVLIIMLIYSIAMAQWRNPGLFTIEQFSINAEGVIETHSAGQPADKNTLDDIVSSKNSGALDASIRTSLLKAVREHMQERQTYLDSELTLTRLSEAVGVSTHHLSEVLNQQEGKNFYQFVNEYRIGYICDALKSNPTIKILDLAMAAGFSSKSTFNAVFKQFTGLTPSQYRSQLMAN
ncbi:MAG: helix-turn-helix domain-containing protein [Arenimonas sp.]